MRRTFFVALRVVCTAALAACGGSSAPPPPADAVVVPAPKAVVPTGPRRKVLVLPMVCHSAAKSLCAFGVGLPVFLAERLENDTAVEPLNAGALVFSPEQANVLPVETEEVESVIKYPTDLLKEEKVRHYAEQIDASLRDVVARSNALALAKGAEYFVTGAFGGWTQSWAFDVRVYAARKEGAELVGSSGAKVEDRETHVSIIGKKNDVGGERLHEAYAQAVAAAFKDADIPLAEATAKAIATPDTKNGYAFLLLSRAYVVRFTGRDPGGKLPTAKKTKKKNAPAPVDTGLGRAAHAVTVDPKNAPAQRFYATLLLSQGKLRSARVHFEEALKVRPEDLRVLVGLGDLEVADGNPDIAKKHLEKVVKLQPVHAHAYALLAKATVALGDPAKAISLYERARDLAPAQPGPRWSLLELYADARRYADAANEARALTGIVKKDPKPWYLLGANLRAAGLRNDAVVAYAEGAKTLPLERRLHLFRADILREDGRKAEAKAAYNDAAVLSWYNDRVKFILKGWRPNLLGGASLLKVIADDTARLEAMALAQENFSLGANDAVLDLKTLGAEACATGAAASSAKFARDHAERYHADASALAKDAWLLQQAFKDGEHHALTTDELVRARKIVAAWWPATRHWREIRTSWRRAVLPLYNRHGCPSLLAKDAPIPDTTRERIEERLATRIVALPEVPPPLYGIPISPSIPPQSADMVTFTVDLRDATKDAQVWLDGVKLGDVAKRTTGLFTATKGPHQLCIPPSGGNCTSPGTIRDTVTLHEHWTITVHDGD